MVAMGEKRKAGHSLPRRKPSWLSCHRIAIFGNRHYSPALDRRLHCDPIGCADGWATAATHAFGSVGGLCGWLEIDVSAKVIHIEQDFFCFGQVTFARAQAEINKKLAKRFPIKKISGYTAPCTCRTLFTIGPVTANPATLRRSGSSGPCRYTVKFTVTVSLLIGVGICK